ncbi:MAG: hypothetical protein LBQ96_08975 [Fusobacteriaceae bacterium]|jgi:hypothetical protein|nr:hypothetical protein [Fusobacteriaceae bacterium]
MADKYKEYLDKFDRELVKANPEPLLNQLVFLLKLLDMMIPLVAVADAYSAEKELELFPHLVKGMRQCVDRIYRKDPEFKRLVHEYMAESIGFEFEKPAGGKKKGSPAGDTPVTRKIVRAPKTEKKANTAKAAKAAKTEKTVKAAKTAKTTETVKKTKTVKPAGKVKKA